LPHLTTGESALGRVGSSKDINTSNFEKINARREPVAVGLH